MMKANRVWVEILLLGTAMACALALLFATLGAVAGVAAAEKAARQETPSLEKAYEGMVTCTRCGAKHSAALGQTAAVCTRVCVRGGASFALVGADETYILDGDLGVLAKLAGQRARIVGERNGNRIHISSVAAQT